MHGKDHYRFGLKLGESVAIPDPSVSFRGVVTGIDRYMERTSAGGINSWISYTLDAEDAPEGSPWKHFWAVDGQAPRGEGTVPFVRRSFYIASENKSPPPGFTLDRDLSGYVVLQSEGNAALSGGANAKGALFTYKGPQGEIWAEEIFEGASRLTFDAVFEK